MLIRKTMATLRAVNTFLERHRTTDPTQEIVYRSLFLKELRECGVHDEFYPVGGAANHSLLYIIARALRTLDIHRVVEFGAGQTSILIDRMRKASGRNYRVTTIEHDALWARHIGAQVDHEILCAPLKPVQVEGHDIHYYDLSPDTLGGPADLLIVDGPPAHEHAYAFARFGILRFTPALLSSDFVAVLDDTQRGGETQLFEALKRQLDDRGIVYRENGLTALKRQSALAAGKFVAAAFF